MDFQTKISSRKAGSKRSSTAEMTFGVFKHMLICASDFELVMDRWMSISVHGLIHLIL